MKKFVCVLLLVFSFGLYAQNDSVVQPKLSTVSADKMNVVYRGVSNPISISVNNAKSFTASGTGLEFDQGKYVLKPGQGLETKILVKIITNDNSEVTEEHVFRIKGIRPPMGKIDGRNCSNCIVTMTKKQLKSAIISIGIEDIAWDFKLEIKSFNVRFPNKKTYTIEKSDQFTAAVLAEIDQMKIGSTFDIVEIIPDYENPRIHYPRTVPIKIMIIDQPIPYYYSKEYFKDSIQKMETERKLLRKKKKAKK